MPIWKSKHKITAGDMAIILFWQDNLCFVRFTQFQFSTVHDLCHVKMKYKYLKWLGESEEDMKGLWELNMIKMYFIPKELKIYLQRILVTCTS